MERHSVAQFGVGRRAPAVQAQEVPHRAKWLAFVLWRHPVQRAHAAGKVEVGDGSAPEVNRQCGRLAFEANRAAAIGCNLGGRYSQPDDECQAR